MIVEIGARPFVAAGLPEETLYFSTISSKDRSEHGRTLPGLIALWRALGDPAVTLIVCQPTFHAPWSLENLSRIIFSRHVLSGRAPLLRSYAPQLLRWRGKAPIVVLDQEDLPVINRNNLFLLDRCRLWFKRELPVDHWRVFLKTAHANLPTPRFRMGRRNRERMAKLRPLSLGIPRGGESLMPQGAAEKTADVFFAGRIEGSSSVRERGAAELAALAAQGVKIDIPDKPLPREEFYRRCAAAWLVWSPEGYGWDCFRHYEALGCGSVPMINLPTIERHEPLMPGAHALYYDPEPGGLTRAVKAALADKPALARIAEAGRAHVLAHHTVGALARHIVETAALLTGDAA